MTNADHRAAGEPDNGRAEDLLAAWALDAVDEVERHAIDRRLESDPGLRAQADALNRTVGRLAASTPATPPADVRDRVLGALAETSQEAPSDRGARANRATLDSQPAEIADLDGHRARRVPDRRRWWVTVASAAAAAVVAVGLVLTQPWAEPGGVSEGDQVTAIEQILQREGAESLASPVTGGGEMEVARAPNGETVLVARDLTEPAEDRAYQLWTIQGEEAPQSAGLLEVQDGRALVRLQDVPADAALAVTVEPDGGSEAPTTDPIAVLAGG